MKHDCLSQVKDQLKTTAHQVSNNFSPTLKEEPTEICMQRNSCRNLAQNEPELAVSKLNPCMRGHIQSSNSYDECDSIAILYSQFDDNDGTDNINIYQSVMPAWVETEPYVIF